MIEDKYRKILESYETLENIIELFKDSEFIDDWECIYEKFIYTYENQLINIFKCLNFTITIDIDCYCNLLRRNNKIRSAILRNYANIYKKKKNQGIPKDKFASELINSKYISKIHNIGQDVRKIKGLNFKKVINYNERRETIEDIKNEVLLKIIYRINMARVGYYFAYDADKFYMFCEDIVSKVTYPDEEFKNLVTNLLILSGNYFKWKQAGKQI